MCKTPKYYWSLYLHSQACTTTKLYKIKQMQEEAWLLYISIKNGRNSCNYLQYFYHFNWGGKLVCVWKFSSERYFMVTYSGKCGNFTIAESCSTQAKFYSAIWIFHVKTFVVVFIKLIIVRLSIGLQYYLNQLARVVQY